MKVPWRKEYNILVTQADSLGAIAVIRSLGQHGYTVFASSSNESALGFKSKYASMSVCSPAYHGNYIPWLRQYISDNQINAIVPSEGFLLAIRDNYEEFLSLLPLSPSANDVYKCLCKVDVFSSFLASNNDLIRRNIPNTVIIEKISDIKNILKQWDFPLFIKGDAYYALEGAESFVGHANTFDEAKVLVVKQLTYYKKVLVQACFSGEKVTVNLLNWQGVQIAESMVLASHQNPHTGGLMSLRKSWWHDEIYQDALARRASVNWHGAAMFEYKWNSETDEFCFIELNSRYWGALNLDILAGVHFPCYQMDAFLTATFPKNTIRLTRHIEVRNSLPADFGYALSRLRDNKLTIIQKTYSLIEFFVLFLHPFIKSDLLYPNDRKLYLLNLWEFIKDFSRACIKKLK